MLLRRYANTAYILNKSFDDGVNFIFKAYETQMDEMLWQRWLVDYRNMNEENFMSFNEYKEKMTVVVPAKMSEYEKEVLLDKSLGILQKVSDKRGEK